MRIFLLFLWGITVPVSASAASLAGAAVAPVTIVVPGDPSFTKPLDLCSMLILDSGGVTEQLEAALQRYRYCTQAAEENQLEAIIYHWMEIELHRYYRYRMEGQYQAIEEMFHDVYLQTIAFLRKQRAANTAPRIYLPYMYFMAKKEMWSLKGTSAPAPIGDLSWLADPAQSDLARDPLSTGVRAYQPPSLSADQYGYTSGAPLPLSGRQLAVLRGLAEGNSHGEMAQTLGVDLKTVHDSVGNVERKMQEVLDNPAIRRSHFRFLPDLGASNRVFIECRFNGKTKLILAEGPIPFENVELKIAGSWVRGESMRTARLRLGLDMNSTREIYLRLLYERRRDFDELYGSRQGIFKKAYDLQLSQSEGQYALLRALGLEKHEIVQALGLEVDAVTARYDRIRAKLQALLHEHPGVIFLRPYYSMLEDSREQLNLVLSDSTGNSFLVRLKITPNGSRHHRANQRRQIFMTRAEAEQRIQGMQGMVKKAMVQRVLLGKSTTEIARELNVRVDTVRKYFALGTLQLGVALGEPELNLFNLTLR